MSRRQHVELGVSPPPFPAASAEVIVETEGGGPISISLARFVQITITKKNRTKPSVTSLKCDSIEST